jgi:hypothetical protein
MWESYIAPIPESERQDFIQAYYKRLTSSNIKEQLTCAKAWSKWECATSKLFVGKLFLYKQNIKNFKKKNKLYRSGNDCKS